MKKSLFAIAAFVTSFAINAQTTYNYFDGADVDANGWLWFDTQEKLDKYCGWGSEYKIQLQPATFEDADGQYAEPICDAYVPGYNADGQQGGDGAKTGAIILPPASNAVDAQNGGGLILHLPDCAEFALYLSCEYNSLTPALKGGKGWVEIVDCAIIRGYLSMGMWSKLLAEAYQYQWNNMQDLKNDNTGLTLKTTQGTKVTAYPLNGMKYPLYIHGIKVLTYTETAGVETITSDSKSITLNVSGDVVTSSHNASIEVYTTSGALVAKGKESVCLKSLESGVYVAHATADNGSATIKITK